MAHASSVQDHAQINHYRILSQLASGGMGIVYKAFDTQLERTVALKFLVPDVECSVADHEQILREARASANLDHRYIANVHAVEETPDGQHFIVMAFYEGESLASKMTTAPIPLKEALQIIHQIVEGLSYAHSHDVVHRDIKPSNIILTPEGDVKIVDFGLARFTRADAATQSLNISGTLMYMSPEHLSGHPVDARSDIWSLGVLAYQLLTTRAPFKERNPAAMVNAILHSTPAPMTDVPEDLQLIVRRALTKDPRERYQSCMELLRDLDNVQSLSTTTFSRHVRPNRLASIVAYFEKPRHALLVALIILLGFVTTDRIVAYLKTLPRQHSSSVVTSSPAAYELYLKGRGFLDRQDKPGALDQAVSAFSETIRSDPEFALGHLGLAEAYWEEYKLTQDAKLIDLAKASLNRALALNAQLPATHVILGRIQLGTGNSEMALQEFQRALTLDPLNSAALIGLGNTYADLRRDREAEETMKRVIDMRPEDTTPRSTLGAFYYGRGRYREAEDVFRSLIELEPDNASTHTSLATCLLANGKLAESEAEFIRAIAIAPSSRAYSNLGAIYFNQKRYSEAAKIFEKAVKLTEKDYRLWTNLALSYDLLGFKDKAFAAHEREFQLLQQVVLLNPKDPTIHAHLAMQYAKHGQSGKARLHITTALSLAPEDRDVAENAGITYELLGDRSKAIMYLALSLQRGTAMEDLKIEPYLIQLFKDPNSIRALNNSVQRIQ